MGGAPSVQWAGLLQHSGRGAAPGYARKHTFFVIEGPMTKKCTSDGFHDCSLESVHVVQFAKKNRSNRSVASPVEVNHGSQLSSSDSAPPSFLF